MFNKHLQTQWENEKKILARKKKISAKKQRLNKNQMETLELKIYYLKGQTYEWKRQKKELVNRKTIQQKLSNLKNREQIGFKK